MDNDDLFGMYQNPELVRKGIEQQAKSLGLTGEDKDNYVETEFKRQSERAPLSDSSKQNGIVSFFSGLEKYFPELDSNDPTNPTTNREPDAKESTGSVKQPDQEPFFNTLRFRQTQGRFPVNKPPEESSDSKDEVFPAFTPDGGQEVFPGPDGGLRPKGEIQEKNLPPSFEKKEEKKEESLIDLVKRAQEHRRRSELIANLGKAFERIAGGLSGTVKGGTVIKPTGDEFYNSLIEQARKSEEGTLQEYKAKKLMEAEAKDKELDDPNSEQSKFAQKMAAKLGFTSLENSSARDIQKYIPYMSKTFQAQVEAQSKAQAAERKETIRQEEKKEEQNLRIKREANKLQEELKEQADALLGFKEFDRTVQETSDVDPNFSVATVDTKNFKGDLAGIAPLGGWNLTPSARKLDAAVQTVLNKAILATSGKAVTKNELERIQKQYSMGMFNTEAEKLRALQRAYTLLSESMKQTQSGYSQEAIDLYKSRGGVTADYMLSTTPSNSKGTINKDTGIEEF